MKNLLKLCGIKVTPKRLGVINFLESQSHPVTATNILENIKKLFPINKVTLYRMLDLFEEKMILIKHRADDRSFRYCLNNSTKEAHCHFLCTECGSMSCLSPEMIGIDSDKIRSFVSRLSNIEIRLDGICKECADRV